MKLLTMLLIIWGIAGFAKAQSSAHCLVVNKGFAVNTEDLTIEKIRLNSYADIFTINNARNLRLTLDGVDARFTRENIIVKKNTEISFSLVDHSTTETQRAYLLLQGTPRSIKKNKEFLSILTVTKMIPISKDTISQEDILATYNLYCYF